MSLTKKQLEAAGIKLEPNDTVVGYFSESAPSPHKAFAYYMYSISVKGGLCSVTGYSHEFEANGAGDQIKWEFSQLERALVSKYGKPKQYQSFRPTAKSNDPKNWMEGLYKQEVDHVSAWTDSKETPLPHSLKQVVLQAQASDISKGGIRLVYMFKNSDVCAAENLNNRDASL